MTEESSLQRSSNSGAQLAWPEPASAAFVLGMHRSGTSYLANLLEANGYHMGEDLIPANSSNPAGHFEDSRLVEFHDSALRKRNLRWDHRKIDGALRFDRDERAWATRYLDERARAAPAWGFKDPRAVLFWPSWQELVPPDALQLAIFRHPFHVATSLFIRNGIPLEAGISLWAVYNKILIEALDACGSRSYYFCFDEPDTIPAILSRLTGKAVSDVHIPEIQHSYAPRAYDLDPAVERLYRALLERYKQTSEDNL